MIEVRRFILCKAAGRVVRLEVSGCPWCTEEAVCSAHVAKADEIRGSLWRSALRRAERRERRPAKPGEFGDSVENFERWRRQYQGGR